MSQTKPLSLKAITLRVWWAWMWRCFLFILPLQAIDSQLMAQSYILQGFAFIYGIAVAIFLIRHVFNRRFRRFEIYFADSNTKARLQPRWPHVLRIYWSMVWRNIIVALIVGIPLFKIAIFMTLSKFAENPNTAEVLAALTITISVVYILFVAVLMLASIYILHIVIGKRYQRFYLHIEQHSNGHSNHSQVTA